MKYLFLLAAVELSLMGSGQTFNYGGFSLRMALFMVLVPYALIKTKLSIQMLRNTIVFICLLVIGSVIGKLNHAPLSLILNDIKPLIFLFYIFPIAYFFQDKTNKIRVLSILKVSSLILASLYLLYVLILQMYPVVKLLPIYLESFNEVFFRPNGMFFYKGFLSLMVGFFLFLYSNSRLKYLACTLLFLTMALTLTRGLIAALVGSFIVLFFIDLLLEKRISKRAFLFIPVVLIALILGLSVVISLYGDKSASDAVRFQIIAQVFERMQTFSLFLGHGLGIGIPVRETHMEIAFLEIWHKQGLLGLSFWLLLFMQAFLHYYNAHELRPKAKPFLLIIISIYLISFTNPFVNNPIGLFPLLVSLIVLQQLDAESLGVHTNLQRRKVSEATA